MAVSSFFPEAVAKCVVPVMAKRTAHLEKDRSSSGRRLSPSRTFGMPVARAGAGSTYQTGTVRTYMSDFMGGWEEDVVYSQEFDEKGQLVSVTENLPGEEEIVVTTYVYNEYGKVVEELQRVSATGDMSDLENVSRIVRSYDPRMHSLITERTEYRWDAGEWKPSGLNYLRDVTRDANGNVTEIVYKTPYENEYEAVQKVVMEYGADGKAVSVTEYQLSFAEGSTTEYVWAEGYSFRDCVWYVTDGQISGTDYVYEGSNKIKSFTEYSEGELVGDISVVYDGDSDDFVSTMFGEGYETGQTWKDLPNGGYFSDMRLLVDLGDGETYEQHQISTEQFNEYDVQTVAVDVDYYADTADVYSWITGVQELNADGAPVSLVLSMFEPAEEEEEEEYVRRRIPSADTDWSQMVPPVEGETYEMMKYEFDDLVKVPTSGVSAVGADENAPVEFYTIDGIRVDNPAAGLFIRRQGTRAEKIILK